ncbi:hypothetical protein ABEG18_03445 [Alsobacter sp. KACC 23698]|uniref:BcpO-related WXXGXW repeat protein n=1 Tax=Alsobacter sp. KACC 23698 TaxID=3149229 RepID=A0AAU7JIN4_9HYPH
MKNAFRSALIVGCALSATSAKAVSLDQSMPAIATVQWYGEPDWGRPRWDENRRREEWRRHHWREEQLRREEARRRWEWQRRHQIEEDDDD